MHYLAFDVSRDSADGVLTTRTLRIRERFHVPNTEAALHPIVERLHREHPKLTVGAESTNMFHLPVVSVCTDLALPCRIVNPLLTKEVLRASIRKRKTDREDAVVIAKLLVQGEGRPMTRGECVDEGKTLVRSARMLQGIRQSLLLHVRHVERLHGCAPDGLVQILTDVTKEKEELQGKAIARSDTEQRTVLTSIPGIGDWLATVLLAEMGNATRFRSGDALIAYAGLDPRVKQSGAMLRTGRLTKRGSPHLRWALCCAANGSRKFDPELRAFYERKRAEGKRHTAALCATARKLTYRVHAVLRRGTPYVVRKSS